MLNPSRCQVGSYNFSNGAWLSQITFPPAVFCWPQKVSFIWTFWGAVHKSCLTLGGGEFCTTMIQERNALGAMLDSVQKSVSRDFVNLYAILVKKCVTTAYSSHQKRGYQACIPLSFELQLKRAREWVIRGGR